MLQYNDILSALCGDNIRVSEFVYAFYDLTIQMNEEFYKGVEK